MSLDLFIDVTSQAQEQRLNFEKHNVFWWVKKMTDMTGQIRERELEQGGMGWGSERVWVDKEKGKERRVHYHSKYSAKILFLIFWVTS